MKPWVLGLILALVSDHSFSQSKTVTLASSEWPPYTSPSLADSGVAAKVVAAAFKAQGYELKVVFVPWERAVYMAQHDAVDGYFPEYFSRAIAKELLYSDPFGASPLGFVEKKGAPVVWKTLDDLRPLTIGVVEGYINTEDFDSRVAAKTLTVDRSMDDATNVVKVANDRIPLAVIDPNVLEYLVNHDPGVMPFRDRVQFDPKVLEMKSLYVCFPNTRRGKELVTVFNSGLRTVNVEQVLKAAWAGLKP